MRGYKLNIYLLQNQHNIPHHSFIYIMRLRLSKFDFSKLCIIQSLYIDCILLSTKSNFHLTDNSLLCILVYIHYLIIINNPNHNNYKCFHHYKTYIQGYITNKLNQRQMIQQNITTHIIHFVNMYLRHKMSILYNLCTLSINFNTLNIFLQINHYSYSKMINNNLIHISSHIHLPIKMLIVNKFDKHSIQYMIDTYHYIISRSPISLQNNHLGMCLHIWIIEGMKISYRISKQHLLEYIIDSFHLSKVNTYLDLNIYRLRNPMNMLKFKANNHHYNLNIMILTGLSNLSKQNYMISINFIHRTSNNYQGILLCIQNSINITLNCMKDMYQSLYMIGINCYNLGTYLSNHKYQLDSFMNICHLKIIDQFSIKYNYFIIPLSMSHKCYSTTNIIQNSHQHNIQLNKC